jgi:GcrA cell cycle regulator
MDWDDNSTRELRDLWAQGFTAAEIGRRLQRPKNSIVGKVHRLDLESRPSPIKGRRVTQGPPPPPSIPRIARPTLPPLPSYEPPPVVEAPVLVDRPRVAAPPPPPPAPLQFRPRSQPCCWPIGHPKDKAFRFCLDPAPGSKPYCDEHAKLAYVRVRDRQEDAA